MKLCFLALWLLACSGSEPARPYAPVQDPASSAAPDASYLRPPDELPEIPLEPPPRGPRKP